MPLTMSVTTTAPMVVMNAGTMIHMNRSAPNTKRFLSFSYKAKLHN